MDRLAKEKEAMSKPFEKCPVCGGRLAEKDVEKLLRGGGNTATVQVRAEVCLHCGERLYSRETVCRFDEIREKLQRHETKGFRVSGQAYVVRNSRRGRVVGNVVVSQKKR